jgi:hypothetical protein
MGTSPPRHHHHIETWDAMGLFRIFHPTETVRCERIERLATGWNNTGDQYYQVTTRTTSKTQAARLIGSLGTWFAEGTITTGLEPGKM